MQDEGISRDRSERIVSRIKDFLEILRRILRSHLINTSGAGLRYRQAESCSGSSFRDIPNERPNAKNCVTMRIAVQLSTDDNTDES